MRLSLYNATVALGYTTTAGTLSVTAFSNARADVADVHVVTIAATGSECNAEWRWHPLPADAMVSASQSKRKYRVRAMKNPIHGEETEPCEGSDLKSLSADSVVTVVNSSSVESAVLISSQKRSQMHTYMLT